MEAAITLKESFLLEFSSEKPVFRLEDTSRCFEGSPLEVMENTELLEALPKFKKIISCIESKGDMACLKKIWIKEYDRIKEALDLVELPYDDGLFRKSLLTQKEIDELIRSLLD